MPGSEKLHWLFKAILKCSIEIFVLMAKHFGMNGVTIFKNWIKWAEIFSTLCHDKSQNIMLPDRPPIADNFTDTVTDTFTEKWFMHKQRLKHAGY